MQRACFLCCLPAMLWSLLAPVCHVSPAPMLFQFLKFTKALINPKNSVISLLHTLASISLILKGMTQLGALQSGPNLYYCQYPSALNSQVAYFCSCFCVLVALTRHSLTYIFLPVHIQFQRYLHVRKTVQDFSECPCPSYGSVLPSLEIWLQEYIVN